MTFKEVSDYVIQHNQYSEEVFRVFKKKSNELKKILDEQLQELSQEK